MKGFERNKAWGDGRDVPPMEDGGKSDFHYGAEWQIMGWPAVKVDPGLRDAQSVRLRRRVANRRNESSVISAERSPQFRESSDEPPPFVDIELHQAFVSHFQQERLASFLIRDIGAFHDLVHFERLLAERAQDIFSIIQHDQTPTVTKRAKSLRIRKLIFRNYPLNIL
jgi:hypothetical protein